MWPSVSTAVRTPWKLLKTKSLLRRKADNDATVLQERLTERQTKLGDSHRSSSHTSSRTHSETSDFITSLPLGLLDNTFSAPPSYVAPTASSLFSSGKKPQALRFTVTDNLSPPKLPASMLPYASWIIQRAFFTLIFNVQNTRPFQTQPNTRSGKDRILPKSKNFWWQHLSEPTCAYGTNRKQQPPERNSSERFLLSSTTSQYA